MKYIYFLLLATMALVQAGLASALPVAIAGISPIVYLPKVPNAQLRLTGEVLSRIFMGEITRWNAADIAALTVMTLAVHPG